MVNHKELLDKLPSSWRELKLKDYQKLTDLVVEESGDPDDLFVGMDNTLKVISALTNTTVSLLEELPFQHIQELSRKMAFITELPKVDKRTTIEWKKIDDVSYNDFVAFVKLSNDPFKHMHVIIQSFSKKKLSPEEALELNMQDCYSGFFLLQKKCKKYVTRTIISLGVKLLKMMTKELWQRFRRRMQRWLRLCAKTTDGIS